MKVEGREGRWPEYCVPGLLKATSSISGPTSRGTIRTLPIGFSILLMKSLHCWQNSRRPGGDATIWRLRSFPVGRYVVFYRLSEPGIEVTRVLSAYRDIETLFG